MTDWKAELQQGFTPPPPAKKREFLRQFPSMPISLGDVLLSQLGYIQTWVWVLSGAIYAAAALMLLAKSPHLLQLLSACAPLLALTIVSESSRSVRFGMAELELSTRFSLKTVVLARLIPLGCIHPLGMSKIVFRIRTPPCGHPLQRRTLSADRLLGTFHHPQIPQPRGTVCLRRLRLCHQPADAVFPQTVCGLV